MLWYYNLLVIYYISFMNKCSHYFNVLQAFWTSTDKWFSIYSIIENFIVFKISRYLEVMYIFVSVYSYQIKITVYPEEILMDLA